MDIGVKFEKAINDLRGSLPKEMPAGCAEATLRHILEILGTEDQMINNIMVPLSGGFGGYKSKKGEFGPCGAVVGGCAAVGAILGGKDKQPMAQTTAMTAYLKSAQFAREFENEFGTILCPDLSGYDFSDPNAMMEYMKEGVWGKTCYKYVLWAIDKVRNIMKKELKKNWD